jgi:hypothetical protein
MEIRATVGQAAAAPKAVADQGADQEILATVAEVVAAEAETAKVAAAVVVAKGAATTTDGGEITIAADQETTMVAATAWSSQSNLMMRS